MPIKSIDLKTYIKPSDYIKFSQGDTTLTIVSKGGGMAKIHSMKTSKGFINLGICTEDSTCEHCKKGYEAKLKWIWVVYWKEKKAVRLLEAGTQIGDGICQVTQKGGLEDFTSNDYIITATGEGFGSRKYSVRLGGKVSLTPEDEAIIGPAKDYLIKKHLK
jgi:hypothetical protein